MSRQGDTMADNVYLKIAQDKGLIDQDDYQGWRLTAKGEGFLSAVLEDDLYDPYDLATRRLKARLAWTLCDWDISTFLEACLEGHPTQIRLTSQGDVKVTHWVDVPLVLQDNYDIGLIIAGQYEAALRQAVEA